VDRVGGIRGRMRVAIIAVLACVALAAAAGIYAAIPSGGNVYTACMLKGVGTIRLIDTSLPSSNLLGHCTSLESQISWNENGQPGPAGPAGPVGPAGAKGDPGAAGANGTNGNDGASVVAVALNPGDDPACPYGGTKFTAGAAVTYACNGAPGAKGDTGAAGATGATGPAGPAGPAGSSGGGSLATLGSLRGTPCTVGGNAGTLSVDVASSGAVTLTCVAGGGGPCTPPAYPNGTTSCDSNGNVVYECDAGHFDLDGDRSNGCETTLVPDSLEPNDTTSQASTITNGAIETIAPSGDVDYYVPIVHTTHGCSDFICTSTFSISVPGIKTATPLGVDVQLVDGSGNVLVANAAGFACGSSDSYNSKTDTDVSSDTCPAAVDSATSFYVKVTAGGPTAYVFG